MSAAHDAILETAKRRWKLVNDSEANQRKRESEDLRYQIAENQWPEDVRREREGDGGYPARPMLAVSLSHQPMQIVQNQAANANLAVKVSPVGEHTHKELAKVKEEMVRRIQRDSNAHVARLWALDRAKQVGRGWYRIVTRYDEDSKDKLDQEIGVERILHQNMVYADPSAEKPDWSDGRWLFYAGWIPLDVFRDLHPDSQNFSSDDDFGGLVGREPDWVRGSGDQRAVLTAEYFSKVFETVSYGGRKMQICTGVKWCKLTGVEVLEEGVWPGHYIPFIPVIGNELQPIDGERLWVGMVRNGGARDAQQFFNMSITSVLERMALEPRAPHLVTPAQIKGFEQWWQQANRRNFPYLPYNETSDTSGKSIGPPQRSQVDTTGTSLAMMGAELGRNLMQSATAIYDPGLGKASDSQESGRKVLALQQQGDMGTGQYLWNLANISMPYEGTQELDLIPVVYDRPGRITTVLGGEDEVRSIMIGVPFVVDPETQQPRAVSEGTPGAQFFDLKEGRYSTSVTIGKSYQTRLQEGREALGEMLPNLPPEAQLLLLPTFLRFQDTPGSPEAADLMKKFRDMKFPGLSDDAKQPMSAEDAKAKVAALEQQVQMLTQQLQQAVQMIETDQAKQQATVKKAEMDNQAKVQIAQLGTQETAGADALKMALEKMEERHEAEQNALDRKLELFLAQIKMAHEAAMAAAQGQTMTTTRDRGRDDGQEREDESSSGQSRQPEQESE